MFFGALIGALLGAFVIGVLSRIFMRILTYYDGRDPSFSWSGSLEVMIYGSLVGCVSGLIYSVLRDEGLARFRMKGLGWGLLTYLITLLTLPSHIAETAAPIGEIMIFVHFGFGAFFLAFGYLLSLAFIFGDRRRVLESWHGR